MSVHPDVGCVEQFHRETQRVVVIGGGSDVALRSATRPTSFRISKISGPGRSGSRRY